MPDLNEFDKLVRLHDLTYRFSDDGRVYARGTKAFNEILKKAKEIGSPAVEIWNKYVDKKMIGRCRETFYWDADRFKQGNDK